MKKIYYIASLLLLFMSGNSFAQSNATKKADKHYDRLEYVDAIEDYKKLVDKGDATPYVYHRLADSYYNLYNSQEAARYYSMYIDGASDASGEAYYRYAQMLKANANYEEANRAMQAFASRSPQDKRAQAFKSNQNYLSDILDKEAKFSVERLSLNTDFIDFGGYEKDGKLYFVSARNKSRRNYGWNDQPTLDVYVSTREGEEFTSPELLEGEVNTKFNEGTVAITPDGNTMYFTRNDYLDGDYEEDEQGVGQLKLFRARLVNGAWDDIQSVPFNSSAYSTGHPALSADGKTLYFSSDMPGGIGHSDLYKVSVSEDGSLGEPQNLGAGINTEGRDSFPYIDEEGTLYFSSDGQLGIGGLDVFYAKAKGSNFGEVNNIGQPINSNGDDFAFTFSTSAKKGYVSSNRGGLAEDAQTANDNIYRVVQLEPIEEIDIMVKVINAETGAPITQAEVLNYNEAKTQVGKKQTNREGQAAFQGLRVDKAYSLQANATGYKSGLAQVSPEERGEVGVTIELSPIKPIIKKEEIVLNPILFDFDKATIRSQAALELDKLVGVMKKHPEMEIKVEAHTDKRGSAEYNQKLSERRAKSTVGYVVSQGIDKSRISWEAFGESKPKVECDNCSEEQYQENRRSVFRIIRD
ncbi:OmpA family protein [Mesonia aquimarina]|uniref:OmpA family protein n=1 Tax=Mesonia aquimarina TaxID=1504967 RepID=UPI000EF631EC|nr:OmpA family protein [Mesonia aquimarina]